MRRQKNKGLRAIRLWLLGMATGLPLGYVLLWGCLQGLSNDRVAQVVVWLIVPLAFALFLSGRVFQLAHGQTGGRVSLLGAVRTLFGGNRHDFE